MLAFFVCPIEVGFEVVNSVFSLRVNVPGFDGITEVAAAFKFGNGRTD